MILSGAEVRRAVCVVYVKSICVVLPPFPGENRSFEHNVVFMY